MRTLLHRHYRVRLLGIVGLFITIAGAPAAEPDSLNDKVVAFCKQHLDQQVGNGECAALAFQALKTAGAKTRAGPDFPAERDYVWRKLIYTIEAATEGIKTTGELGDIRPGDIIQYRNTRFITAQFAHHTSVVAKVEEKARNLQVYQQNIAGRRFVSGGLVRLNNLKEGYMRIYRPLKVP